LYNAVISKVIFYIKNEKCIFIYLSGYIQVINRSYKYNNLTDVQKNGQKGNLP